MKITPVKTKPIIVGDKLFGILGLAIKSLPENSVVAITSKIISICEGNVVKVGTVDKDLLVQQQSDYYLPPDNRYNFSLSIKNNILIPNAGIDESNGNGYFILWPKKPQKTANFVRSFFKKKFRLKNIGVIIVDSKTMPLRWGVTGVAIAHSGFSALNDYIGTPDIFGRLFKVEKANIADMLASSAVCVMGEGREQTPITVIEDLPFVHFQKGNPTKKELRELDITMEEDLYAELLKKVEWKKGGN